MSSGRLLKQILANISTDFFYYLFHPNPKQGKQTMTKNIFLS